MPRGDVLRLNLCHFCMTLTKVIHISSAAASPGFRLEADSEPEKGM